VEADKSLAWETKLVDNAEIRKLRGRVVRLSIHESESPEPPSEARREEPLVSVELMLPEERPEDRDGADADIPLDTRRPEQP